MRTLPSQHVKYFIRCQRAEHFQQGLPLFVRLGSDSQLYVRLLGEEGTGQELPRRARPLGRVCSFRSPPENPIPALRNQAKPLFCRCRTCASREALGRAQWLRYHVCDGLGPVPGAQPSWQKGAGNPALASTRVQWALAWRTKGSPFLTNLPFSVKSCLARRWQWSLASPSAIQELPLSSLPDIIKTSVFLSTFSE